MTLQGVPSGAFDLVAFGEEIPREKACKVLDCAVGLVAGEIFQYEVRGERGAPTLSRPRVVPQTFSD